MARPITMPVEAPNACRMRATIRLAIVPTENRQQLAARGQRQAGEHHRPAAEAVRQRPEHELRDREAEQIERERELHGVDVGGERFASSGIAGTRILSEIGPIASSRSAAAAGRHGVAGRRARLVVQSLGAEVVHARAQHCPSGRVAASSQGRVASSTSGAERLARRARDRRRARRSRRRRAAAARSAGGRSAPRSASRRR